MKRKYDVVFSLGAACLCSQILRKEKLQHASYPLDWIFGMPFLGRIDLILNRFDRFIDASDLEFRAHGSASFRDVYYNHYNTITFNHDFLFGVPFEEMYPKVAKRYARRQARLLGDIDRAKRVLVVWVEAPDASLQVTDAQLIEGYEKLQARYPEKCMDILCMSSRPESGESNPHPHVRHLFFDYVDPNASLPHIPNYAPLRKALREYRLTFHQWKRLKAHFTKFYRKRILKR